MNEEKLNSMTLRAQRSLSATYKRFVVDEDLCGQSVLLNGYAVLCTFIVWSAALYFATHLPSSVL